MLDCKRSSNESETTTCFWSINPLVSNHLLPELLCYCVVAAMRGSIQLFVFILECSIPGFVEFSALTLLWKAFPEFISPLNSTITNNQHSQQAPTSEHINTSAWKITYRTHPCNTMYHYRGCWTASSPFFMLSHSFLLSIHMGFLLFLLCLYLYYVHCIPNALHFGIFFFSHFHVDATTHCHLEYIRSILFRFEFSFLSTLIETTSLAIGKYLLQKKFTVVWPLHVSAKHSLTWDSENCLNSGIIWNFLVSFFSCRHKWDSFAFGLK